MQGTVYERIVDLEEKVERLEKRQKREKGKLFSESDIFDKREFFKVFSTKGWSKEQCAYYYDMAVEWSGEKNRKSDWKLTLSNWAKKDKMEAKGFFGKNNNAPKKQEPKQLLYMDNRSEEQKEADRLAAIDAVNLGRAVLSSFGQKQWVSGCCQSETRVDVGDGHNPVRICASCGKPCELVKHDNI